MAAKQTSGRRSIAVLIASLVGAAGLTGCEVGSYLDPSVTGRWERTPTTVPILERISSVEPVSDQFLEVTDIQPEDLIPEPQSYRLSAGDIVNVIVFDLPVRGQQTPFQRRVEEDGTIQLAGIGSVVAAGLTAIETERAVISLIRSRDLIVGDPIVTVEALTRQDATYNVIGAAAAPGPFNITRPDLRLLDAIAAAGGIDETAPEIFVIRQTPLSDLVERGTPVSAGGDTGENDAPASTPGTSSNELLDLIDELNPNEGAPSLVGRSQPDTSEDREPVVDLVEEAQGPDQPGAGDWVYLNDQWVQVTPRGAGLPESEDPLADPQGLDQLVTQRVIAVPVDKLLSGDARVNIVIRPGDVIRIPPAPSGAVFMAGFVGNPGAIPLSRGLTLLRAVDSVGGLSGLAIPERVDLTRMIGNDRQATIRLNLRAIAEQTQPDIFLKPNDRVNVGTNFWAFPLAVIRGGFRSTYGFGFLLDRNFGNDVFGAPPTNFNN